MQFRPYPLMTILGLLGLGVLIWLGNWQWGRYAEKIGQPAALAAEAPAAQRPGFRPLAEGMAPQFVYGIADGESVWRRVVAAVRADTGAPVLLVTDAIGGANPVDRPLPDTATLNAMPVRIFKRDSRPSGRDDPARRLWYGWDTAGLATSLALSDTALQVAEPVTLTITSADDPSRSRQTPNPYAAPRPIDPLPPQRHFGYALTWWGLAAALVGVYLAFHMAQGRLSFRSGR